MSVLSSRLIRYVRFPLALSAIGLALVLGFQGLQAAWLTLVLLLLEISLSFDNAIVNARVLDRMTPGQQKFFLTWGLVIPVFGVRFLGPLVMVALAGQVGLGEALDAALHHPDHYRELLEIAEPRILAFGGMFLLMVCLRYFFNEAKSLHWMRVIESKLSRAGRIESLEVALALVVLLLLQIWIPAANRGELLIAGVIGLVLQILCTSLAEAFGSEEEAVGRAAAGGGIASLIYLELLDASFSLDGTVGAFAITSELPLILTGLGLGALFIRAITLMLVRERALDELIYLEHGAHYAIGALGLLMLAKVVLTPLHIEMPEWLSGLIGILFLVLALADSLRHRRRQASLGG